MTAPTDTASALRAHFGNLSHRGICAALGLPETWRGTVGRVLAGRTVSVEAENAIRVRLELPPLLPRRYSVEPCPSCGGLHVGDCHGVPAAAVVVLAPGERVRRARREAQRWSDMPVATVRRAVEGRKPYSDGNEF